MSTYTHQSTAHARRGRAALLLAGGGCAVVVAFLLGGLVLGAGAGPAATSRPGPVVTSAAVSAPGWAVAKTPREVAFFQQLDDVDYAVMGAAEQGETLAVARYVCALHDNGLDDARTLLAVEDSRQLRRGNDAAVVVAAISNLC